MYFTLNAFCFNSSHTEVLGNILLSNWHICHEDIARIMQKIKDPDSIFFLEKAMYLDLDYLKYNESEALIRKCAFALGDIKTSESIDIIIRLSNSENLIIKKTAIEQINRFKKLT